MTIEIKWNDGETVKTSTISNDKILSTKMVSGKNQPFGAVEATFDRYIFSSEYKDDNWDSTSNPLPNITLGESKMSVDTFGSVTDYIITSVSNDEDYTVVTAHHPAYTLTHTYFNSLFLNIYTVYQTFDNYTRFSVNLPGWSGATFTSDAPNDWYRAQSNKGCSYKYSSTLSGSGHPGSYYETPQKMYNISRYASGVGYYGGKEGYEEVAKKKHTVWYTYRDINLILHISVETVGGKNIRSIEWVEGETEDIVRFIIMMGVSDDVYPQTFSPPMTYYPDFDLDTGLIGADPKKEYTENELNKAMSKGLVNLNQESYASYDFGTSIGSGLSTSRIRLRVNGTSTCKSILDAIGSFTNRKYHFSSEGFFMTNNVPNSDAKQYFVKDGTFGHKKVTINTHKVVYLDMDTSSEYKGVEAEMTSTAPDIIDNTDAVVISSQTVYGENYSWKTSNISSSASKEGSKILFPIVDMSDDNTEGINSYRNRMLGLCAYNELVNRYRYENSIVYTTSEIDAVPKIEGGTPIGDYDEFLRETGQLYVSGDTSTYPTGNYSIGDTILFDDGIVMEKVKKDGAGIRDWVETDLYELSSSYKYSADSCTKLLKDNYNGFELNNVPLAFLIRSYPEHLTTLAWGKSHTNDLPEQLREQQEDIMINGSPGDEDAEISNKYSSRLVVGNLTQSQLAEQDDVKNGFTGLIMEKNVGAELYRLAGYDNGVVQAEFDTRGRISAGAGTVLLDEDGLKMEDGGVSLGNDGLIFTDESHGTVELGSKGMVLKDTEGNQQLIIDGKGIHDGDGRLYINDNGLTYSDVLVASEDAFHIKARREDGYDMSVDIRGEIDISADKINGGGVTLSNKGLILDDIDGDAGSIILSNVNLDGDTYSKGLVALDPDGEEQFSLTGLGLKLQDTEYNSMFMDSNGLSFEDTNPYDKDGTTPRKKSLIYMNSSALTFSQWMKINNHEGYYEQVKLDGRGLSVQNDAILIDRQGFKAKGVTINEAGINIDRGGVVLDEDGLSFDQGVKLTSDGLSAGGGKVLLDEDGLSFDQGVKLTSEGLSAGDGVLLNSDGLSAGGGRVLLDEDGLSFDQGVKLTSEGLSAGDGVLLSEEGLRLEDKPLSLITLDNRGMYIYGPKKESEEGEESGYSLRLIIDGNGVRDKYNKFLIDDDGLTVTDKNSTTPFLKLNEDGFNLNAEHEHLSESLFNVKGQISIDENLIDGGGVTLSNRGLVMESDALDDEGSPVLDDDGVPVSNSIVLANTDDVQGLIASKGDVVQLSLTGEGLSLPGNGDDENPESMKLDRGGITFKKGSDNTEGASIIKMTAGELKFSKYMELEGTSGYYEQLKIDGKGLCVADDLVTLNRAGLSFKKGGVTLNDSGFGAPGIRINDEGLTLHKTVEGEEKKVAQMTAEGLEFISEEMDEAVITLGSEGLRTNANNLTIDGDGLTTLQGGVKISSAGIDTIVDGDGVKLNQNGLSLYSKSKAVSKSTLKFIKGGGTEVTMGTISSGQVKIPVPDARPSVTGGISEKVTYATIIEGQSSDEGDSTLILRSTSKGLTDETTIKSSMSNKGAPIYMEYTNTVTLASNPNGINSIPYLGDTLMGYSSSRFPSGMYDEPKNTRLRVTVEIEQPCGSTNWGFIRYYGIDVKVGGVSLTRNLGSLTPDKSSYEYTLTSSNLGGVKLGTTVSVKLNYGSTMDMFWFMFEHCRPKIKVTGVRVEGGITTTQNATLPAQFNNANFTYAYWSGSFLELSHIYKNTIKNNTSRRIYFKLYRDGTSTGASRTISAGGTVNITSSDWSELTVTGMYNAQYKMYISNLENPAKLEAKMDAEYVASISGGGHIYLRDDGNYLRGNTEIRGGDKARLSIRSSEGGNTWGATGIDFHNSNLYGSPVLSESFMNSIRSNLPTNLHVSNIKVSGYTTGTWYKNDTAHPMIIMFTNNSTFGSITLQNESGVNISGGKVVEGAVQGQGSGWNSYTAICPPHWSFYFTGDNTKRYFTCLLRI